MVNGWLTPDTIPTETVCRKLVIPAEFEEIYSAVSGALYPLTLPENWEKFGTITPEQIAARMLQMYLAFLNSECDEPPMTYEIGDIKLSASLQPQPTGWLECDGASLLRTDYPALFTALGTQWGAVDSTHFNIPDYRSRVPMGQGRLDGNAANPLYQMGQKFGELKHQLTVAELAEHQHDTIESNLWQITTTGAAGVAPSGAGVTLDINTGMAGGDEPHNNIQPVSVCRYFIYAGV